MRSGGGVQQVSDIADQLRDLTTVPPDPDATEPELLARVHAWRELRCLAEAGLAAAVGTVHRRGAGEHDGARSTKAWLRSFGRFTPREAAALVAAGMGLADLPMTAAA